MYKSDNSVLRCITLDGFPNDAPLRTDTCRDIHCDNINILKNSFFLYFLVLNELPIM